MILALTLADFKEQFPFSVAIEVAQVAPFVRFSYDLDILPLLGHEVLEGIELTDASTISEYVEEKPVLANELVARRERVYRATLADLTTAPPSEGWAYEPLLTLWSEYLKRYWVSASFGRYLTQTGFNVTKAGLTTPTDPAGTFRPASSAERATVQAATDTTTEALRSRLTAFLHAETQAHAKAATTGYDYGKAYEACHAPTSHRTRLRGINRRR